MSMIFFLVIVLVLGTDIPVYFGKNTGSIGWHMLFTSGVLVPIVCLVLLGYAGGFAYWLVSVQF